MKTSTLNLLILDDNNLMVGPLSSYLNQRFGARINISAFFDTDICIKNIDENSHVIILDYFSNGQENGTKNGMKNFNSIKKQNPKAEVTMITSDGDIERVTEEMKRGTIDYIMKRERYLYDLLFLINRVVVAPINKLVTLPVRSIRTYYNLKAYAMMFLVAFISVGILVIVGYLSAQYFATKI